MRNIFVCVFLWSIGVLQGMAQSFPVQAQIQITPPYSLYLADYTRPEDQHLFVNFTVTDLSVSNLQVKLFFTFQGEGITISTRQGIQPTPMTINGGDVVSVSSTDLSYYFDANNLNFQGITKEQYMRSGKLPEGIYQVYVQVVEYRREVPVSANVFAPAWMVLNDPPRWITPTQDEKVKANDPQYLLLNWQAMHTGSPNSSFTVEYELVLVEVWPTTRNPNDAINVSVPLIKTTTNNTTYFIGPADPPLVVGRRYAARLRATDMAGKDLFKNNGYSEVLTFTYGAECPFPIDVKDERQGNSSIKITWTNSPGNTDYTVRFRVKTQTNQLDWYEETTTQTSLIIDRLKPGVFEYQVKANCSTLDGPYSPVDTFTIASNPINSFQCDNNPGVPFLEDKPMKASLARGEMIEISGFSIELTEVSGSAGTFSGKGILVVPFMNNVKIGAQFTDIKVNEDNVVTDGIVTVDNAQLQLLTQEEKDRIENFLHVIEQHADVIDSYLANSDQILQQVDYILTTMDNLPDYTQQFFAEARDLINRGKALIANGNTQEGITLIERAKKLISAGINAVVNGGGELLNTIATLSGDFSEWVRKSLSDIQLDYNVKLSRIKIDFSQLHRDRSSARDRINNRNSTIRIGDRTHVDTHNDNIGGVMSVELSDSESEVLMNDADYSRYVTFNKRIAQFRDSAVVYLYYIVIVNELLKDDNFNLLLTDVRADLRDDVTSMTVQTIRDVIDGKNPELDKKLKDYLRNKIQEFIRNREEDN